MAMKENPEPPASADVPAVRRELPVFVNPAAGRRGDEVWPRLVAALRTAGVDPELRPVEPKQLRSTISTFVDDDSPEIVGVSGGDGSLRAGASALAGTAAAFAVFPTGTLNHFAQRHDIDDLDIAAAAAAGARMRNVPLGVVDDDFFLNTVTFGFYAEVVRRRERWRRWLRKWPAAAVALTALFVRLPTIEIELLVDGKPLRRTTPLLWVGLGFGAFPRAHEAAERRREPELEVAILRTPTRRAAAAFVARLVPRLLHGERPVEDPALELLHARSVLVRGPAKLDVTMDGEVFSLEAPVYVGVQDDAIKLVIPEA
jgi:diacylglycerol kinase family enzyme